MQGQSVAASARSRGPVAGVMRSTMPFGKATLAATQSAKAGSDSRARPTTAALRHMAIAGQVVARHHGKGQHARRPGAAARRQGWRQRRCRGVGVRGICHDLGVAGIKAPGGGIDEIAALGHGQRNDADCGSAMAAIRAALSGCTVDEADHRADAAGAVCPRGQARSPWKGNPAPAAHRASAASPARTPAPRMAQS